MLTEMAVKWFPFLFSHFSFDFFDSLIIIFKHVYISYFLLSSSIILLLYVIHVFYSDIISRLDSRLGLRYPSVEPISQVQLSDLKGPDMTAVLLAINDVNVFVDIDGKVPANRSIGSVAMTNGDIDRFQTFIFLRTIFFCRLFIRDAT